jgi:hypothetical protein
MSNTKERFDRLQQAYDNQSPTYDAPGLDEKMTLLADEIEKSIWEEYKDDTTFILIILERLINKAWKCELQKNINDLLIKTIDSAGEKNQKHHPIYTVIRYAVRAKAIEEARELCEDVK